MRRNGGSIAVMYWQPRRNLAKFESMTYIVKPKFHHPALPKNSLGYTHRDYEG